MFAHVLKSGHSLSLTRVRSRTGTPIFRLFFCSASFLGLATMLRIAACYINFVSDLSYQCKLFNEVWSWNAAKWSHPLICRLLPSCLKVSCPCDCERIFYSKVSLKELNHVSTLLRKTTSEDSAHLTRWVVLSLQHTCRLMLNWALNIILFVHWAIFFHLAVYRRGHLLRFVLDVFLLSFVLVLAH